MHIVQILLPLTDNQGRPQAGELFNSVRMALVEQFGGLTAYTRSPAEGLWDAEGETDRDEVVIFEVMTDRLDRARWASYRAHLEERFKQEQIVVRTQSIELL